MSIALSLIHLRVDLIARSQVRLGGYQAGERLRNCLANVMLRATCVENPRRAKPDPEHTVHYPVWGRSVRVTPLGKGVSNPTKGVGSKPPKPSKSKLSVKGNSLESIIAKDADDIVKQNYETAIVYDSNGNVILRKDGSASQVSFTAAEEKLMKDGILTHNHPTRGGSFSDNDINSFMALDLQEIRAVRDKYLYVLTRTPGKWD